MSFDEEIQSPTPGTIKDAWEAIASHCNSVTALVGISVNDNGSLVLGGDLAALAKEYKANAMFKRKVR